MTASNPYKALQSQQSVNGSSLKEEILPEEGRDHIFVGLCILFCL